jgi:hypothetical protein
MINLKVHYSYDKRFCSFTGEAIEKNEPHIVLSRYFPISKDKTDEAIDILEGHEEDMKRILDTGLGLFHLTNLRCDNCRKIKKNLCEISFDSEERIITCFDCIRTFTKNINSKKELIEEKYIDWYPGFVVEGGTSSSENIIISGDAHSTREDRYSFKSDKINRVLSSLRNPENKSTVSDTLCDICEFYNEDIVIDGMSLCTNCRETIIVNLESYLEENKNRLISKGL